MRRRSVRAAKRAGARPAYRVFVSHATADKWLARMFCEKIESTGATTFRDDRDIAGGDRIPDEIRRAIIQSDELLVVLTPESVHRPWVLFEVGAAWGRRGRARIVAVLCHVRYDRIPAMIDNRKAISINEFDTYLEELKRRMERRSR